MDADGLDRLLRDAVASEAARQRTSERVLRKVAADEATLVGSLVALAERRSSVAVRTTAGRTHRGFVAAVGRDFACLVTGEAPGVFVFVALDAVSSVRSEVVIEGGGSRAAPLPVSLAAVLAGLSDGRPRVQVGASGSGDGGLLAGELRSVGADVLTLRLDGDGRPAVMVPIAAVRDVVVLER